MRSEEQKLSMFSEFRSNLNCQIPCITGELYLRIATDGSAVPCCMAETVIGNVFKQSLAEVWNSDARHVFCEKLRKIHQEKFHLTDPEWFFCRDCPHAHLNSFAADSSFEK